MLHTTIIYPMHHINNDSDEDGDGTTILYLINIGIRLVLISCWGCFLGVGSGATADESTHIQCAERSSVCGRTIHRSQQYQRYMSGCSLQSKVTCFLALHSRVKECLLPRYRVRSFPALHDALLSTDRLQISPIWLASDEWYPQLVYHFDVDGGLS
jgi:hypothetical protein